MDTFEGLQRRYRHMVEKWGHMLIHFEETRDDASIQRYLSSINNLLDSLDKKARNVTNSDTKDELNIMQQKLHTLAAHVEADMAREIPKAAQNYMYGTKYEEERSKPSDRSGAFGVQRKKAPPSLNFSDPWEKRGNKRR